MFFLRIAIFTSFHLRFPFRNELGRSQLVDSLLRDAVFSLFHLKKRPLMSSVQQTWDGGCIFEVGSDFVVFVLVASRSPVPKASRLPNFRPTVKREKAHRKSRNDPRFYSHRRRRCSIRDGYTASDEAAFWPHWSNLSVGIHLA